ncbi:sodium/proline symporter PutP [Nocardiopsis sp. RSe5-2]|uniref:Sodium/proline symporter n=1 Tax=Nocardiopsis endophytica TaxID=3018445 RepID=A0ABT4U8R6_9ACTN|nr:sodium/proline symporter PutP [Nocardiopsis endophytica]MDA2813345.1 sodium/proline symporter PutP [Nocardiopsis endophytica]
MDKSLLASILTFAAYFVVMVGIGLWVYKRTVSLSDFVLGGRRLNSWVAGLSANASDFSGWLLLGLPGAIYLSGLGEAWIAVGLALGFAGSWIVIAGRLRVYTERATDARSGGESDSLTLSSYLENRFSDRTGLLRGVSAVLILAFYLFYVASGLVAMGGLFEQVFGMSSAVAIIAGVSIVVFYTFLGGFLAVSYTDVVQAVMMWVALLIVPIVAVVAIMGDEGRDIGGISAVLGGFEGQGSLDIGGVLAPVVVISGLAWGIGYLGQPHILARFMGIRSVKDVPRAGAVSVAWAVSAMTLAVVMGFAGVAFFGFEEGLENSENVFPSLIQALMNPWVAGLLLAAILAAVMSTADSQLLVASSALTEDGYRAFLKRDASPLTLVWVSRGAVVAVAVAAAGIALSGNNTVMDLVGYAWAGFGAGFGPVILLSLYWKRMTWTGALAGMVGGGATAVIWDVLDEKVLETGLYAMVPAVVVSLVGIFVFNGLGRATDAMGEDFDRVDTEYREAKKPVSA